MQLASVSKLLTRTAWADKGSRFTKSFEQEVAWLAQRTDVSAVANYFRVTWRSVRRIIQRVVAEQRDERRELDGLRVIGMDEISYRKRHKYLTLIAKSSKHENAKQPHWAQARSSCWGTRSPPL